VISVLLVDDDPALFNITKILLEKEGELSVDLCSSAIEALEKLAIRDYDTIVSDYDMPVMNGIQFLRQIRNNGDRTPFIIFTGKGNEDVVIEALNNGADYYLKKVGDPKEIFSELRSVILEKTKIRIGILPNNKIRD